MASVKWPSDAMHRTNDLPYDTVAQYLQEGRIVIANVMKGRHFVLVVGMVRLLPISDAPDDSVAIVFEMVRFFG